MRFVCQLTAVLRFYFSLDLTWPGSGLSLYSIQLNSTQPEITDAGVNTSHIGINMSNIFKNMIINL